MNSQGMSSADPRPLSDEDERTSSEDPSPSILRPQEIPTATATSLPPRPREQALPEKDDDRFFDRWVVDKARELGSRAVKQSVVARLQKTATSFAEWRSLRHEPDAERESMDDKALVASTDATIVKAKAEASRLTEAADVAERRTALSEADVELVARKRSALRPALRGSESDLALAALASLVVLAVDVFIIHLALGRIPGDEQQYWLTAVTMGAGAVVVGDALGWLAAAGIVRKDGTFGRPGRPLVAAAAVLLILAIWFFVELGGFRDEALKTIGERDNLKFGDPSFFTVAQILFLLGAAVVSFGYVARRHGRELDKLHTTARERRDDHHKQANALRGRAERAEVIATNAPALRKQAEERIAARKRIAKGEAERDKKQGKYLESLIEPEYARERADVESGARYWQFEARSTSTMSTALRWGLGVAATLAGGGIAYWVTESVFGAVATAVVVAFAYAAMTVWASFGNDEEGLEREQHQRYIAKIVATVRFSDERSTDIERLVPFPPSPDPDHKPSNGNAGNGQEQAEWDALKKRIYDERNFVEGGSEDV